ncbi:MAG TPA: NADH-quinone oxidoreductase subunit L [Gaiellaceae bacterium]|nr:NADH-quinone oxidoreductase subunit L [Gaiellaceae bacterium]
MSVTTWAWLVIAFPLAGTTFIGLAWPVLAGRGRAAGWIGTLAIAASFVCAIGAFIALQDRADDARQVTSTLYEYANSVGVNARMTILVDPLSVLMALVVSGVSMLIHLYSVTYMTGDRGFVRYFAYLNYFVFSMLLLVLAGNFMVLIIGWAFVGAASYLLISFWYRRRTATAAGIKAFVVNVVGDVGLVLGTYFIFRHSHTLDFLGTFKQAGSFPTGDVTAGCIGLLVGAAAKSAQIPLHTWLADAMEGPTPVSALIHAATMVTAGVYLVVRAHAVFEAAPAVHTLVAWIGCATLLLAGLIALVQTNIKRVIAYSTMSQIGYMFLAAGIGAYASSMFHLMTHAFFKALLFLAAGIVIHALAGEEDMRRMGGLRHMLPRTWWAFLVGGFALSGLFPFAGFFSKDSIIAAAWGAGGDGVALFALALVGVFLTALYTFRMVFVVWGGEPSPFVREHLHRPRSDLVGVAMAIPVAVLTVLSVVGGWIQWAIIYTPIDTWLEPVAPDLVAPTTTEDVLTSVFATIVSVGGIVLAWAMYSAHRVRVPSVPWARRLLERKFWFDEAYDVVFYRPADAVAHAWTRWVEGPVVGGSIDGVATGTRELGRGVSAAQTGYLRTYVLALALGAALLFLVYMAAR